ncbi:MAG: hypothetical protein HF973_09975 [Chloroflexi bacterium]|nr:hypothetical protein [Chloroflexota bacterium]
MIQSLPGQPPAHRIFQQINLRRAQFIQNSQEVGRRFCHLAAGGIGRGVGTAKYAPAIFPPAEGARHDWEILRELRNRLENRYEADRSTMLGKMDFQRRLRPDQILDLGLRFGPYGANGINTIIHAL